MDRRQFERMAARIEEIGADSAWAEFDDATDENADAEDFRVRAYGHDDDEYVPGCGADDSYDHRGRPLLSRYNEAGEPRW